jgi:hypothetical protein
MSRRFSTESWFVFALVLVFSIGGLLLLEEESQRGTMFERYSSLRAEPDGLLGFYQLCKKRGCQVQRSTRHLIALPEQATVVIVQPPLTDFAVLGAMKRGGFDTFLDKELKAIRQWVEGGGRLLVFSSAEDQVLKAFDLGAESIPINEEEVEFIATPVSLLPLTARAQALKIKSGVRLVPQNSDWIPLYTSDKGLVAAVRPVKKGSVIAVSDPFPITNEGIRESDNAEFLGWIIDSSQGPIIFDELRHGLAEKQNVMNYARKSNLHLVFFQALIIYALVWWASAARSGRIRAPQSTSHIESREFLGALANIFAKASLQGYALHWFEQRLILTLRHLFNDDELASLDGLSEEEVAKRLRDIGVSNYKGFEAYMSYRKALLAKNKKNVFAADGHVLWSRVKTLPEREFVALARLAIKLERDWLSHGGLHSGEKLLQEADRKNKLLLSITPKKDEKKDAANEPAEDSALTGQDQASAARDGEDQDSAARGHAETAEDLLEQPAEAPSLREEGPDAEGSSKEVSSSAEQDDALDHTTLPPAAVRPDTETMVINSQDIQEAKNDDDDR